MKASKWVRVVACASFAWGCNDCGPAATHEPKVVLSDTADLRTTEAGGTATFMVALDSAPSADVVIPLATSDATEGSVAPSSLTFTRDNWNAPQSVLVTGIDDDLADHDVAYSVVFAAFQSDDARFAGVDPDDVAVVNIDDDTAGVFISPRTGLTTTESGGTAQFEVVLNARPTSDVTVAVSSGAPDEGSVAPATLTFTPDNWNAPQTVLATGQDDHLADGPQVYQVQVGPVTSADADYAALDPENVPVSNTDDDSAGVTLSTTDGASGEDGSTASVAVVLNSQPTADVVLTWACSDATEASAAPTTTTFTPDDWNVPQTVLLTGQDDALADGDQPYQLSVTAVASDDAGYAGLAVTPVSLTNADDDSAGITVAALDTTTGEDGSTADITFVLDSEPTADVRIDLAIFDASEGTALPLTLTFTSVNWSQPQHVVVTGVDDPIVDGGQPNRLLVTDVTSADADYEGRVVLPVALTNADDDSAGLVVSAVSGPTTEEGGTATFTVRLASQPAYDVTVQLDSTHLDEGSLVVDRLDFTSANWSDPQLVTVRGEDDNDDDGDKAYSIQLRATSGDPLYMVGVDVPMTNTDDDEYRTVNDVVWAAGRCGESCVDVCGRIGTYFAPQPDDVAFELQNEPQECQALAELWGFSGYSLGNYAYACLEDSEGDHSASFFVGELQCSTDPNCPSQHRTSMDDAGVPCGPGSRRSICPCGSFFIPP